MEEIFLPARGMTIYPVSWFLRIHGFLSDTYHVLCAGAEDREVALFLALGEWAENLVHGPWSTAFCRGLWTMVHGNGCGNGRDANKHLTYRGLWTIDYGLVADSFMPTLS